MDKIFICNQEKQNTINNLLLSRNIPDKKFPIIEDYRSEIRVNHNQVNLNTYNHNQNYINQVDNFNSIVNELEPGKHSAINFLKKIDIDSELRIKQHHTFCPSDNFTPNLQKLTHNPYVEYDQNYDSFSNNYKDTLCHEKCRNVWNNKSFPI